MINILKEATAVEYEVNGNIYKDIEDSPIRDMRDGDEFHVKLIPVLNKFHTDIDNRF